MYLIDQSSNDYCVCSKSKLAKVLAFTQNCYIYGNGTSRYERCFVCMYVVGLIKFLSGEIEQKRVLTQAATRLPSTRMRAKHSELPYMHHRIQRTRLPVALPEHVLRGGTLTAEVVDFILDMLVDSLDVLHRQRCECSTGRWEGKEVMQLVETGPGCE